MSKNEEIDYLTEDPILSEQKFMCISFLKPSSIEDKYRNKDLTVCGVKVRGCYSTYEEAKQRADFLQKCDSYHNIYIGEVGKWCPFEDDPEKAKDSEYMNKDLNKLMKTYANQQAEAKEFHEIRKQDMVKKAIEDTDKKKKEQSENSDKKKKSKDKSGKLTEMKNDLESNKEELDNEKNKIDENINALRKLQDELDEKYKEIELENSQKKK
jgi:hypothetical protein